MTVEVKYPDHGLCKTLEDIGLGTYFIGAVYDGSPPQLWFRGVNLDGITCVIWCVENSTKIEIERFKTLHRYQSCDITITVKA